VCIDIDRSGEKKRRDSKTVIISVLIASFDPLPHSAELNNVIGIGI
jgi:hypothetical protein